MLAGGRRVKVITVHVITEAVLIPIHSAGPAPSAEAFRVVHIHHAVAIIVHQVEARFRPAGRGRRRRRDADFFKLAIGVVAVHLTVAVVVEAVPAEFPAEAAVDDIVFIVAVIAATVLVGVQVAVVVWAGGTRPG